jgi:hypothetical protein
MHCPRGQTTPATDAGPPHRFRPVGPRPVSRVRTELLAAVADRVPTGRRVRMGVDGRGGAGKTVFADELAWDFSLYIHVDLAVSLVRMSARDDLPIETTRRYTGAHRLYLDACDPLRRASIVVDNTDLGTPGMINTAG